MLAVFVPGSFTVLTAGVRQEHRIVIRLLESSTEAAILGHLILRVGKLAVRTSPVEEGEEFAPATFSCSGSLLLLKGVIVTLVFDNTTLLFFLIITNVLFETLIEFLNPALNATKMERLAALATIPEC